MIDTVDQIIDLGMLKDGINVLDVGCGFGNWAVDFQKRMIKVSYIGLDVNMGRIMTCQSHIVHDDYQFRLMDVRNSSYNKRGKLLASEATFPAETSWADLVICHSLFTHLGSYSNATRYMSEIKRVLRPGGNLWITFFQSPPNEPSIDTLRTVYTVGEIDNLLEGFKIIHASGGFSTDHNDQLMIGARKL